MGIGAGSCSGQRRSFRSTSTNKVPLATPRYIDEGCRSWIVGKPWVVFPTAYVDEIVGGGLWENPVVDVTTSYDPQPTTFTALRYRKVSGNAPGPAYVPFL